MYNNSSVGQQIGKQMYNNSGAEVDIEQNPEQQKIA